MKQYLEIIYTKPEADNLLAEIEELERNLFRLSGRVSFSPLLSQLVQEQGVDLKIKSQVNEFFETLKNELSKLVVLDLTVAIKPSAEFLARTCHWLRAEIDQKAILDIKVDPSIVAGAIISFKGKYRDLSVGKKLEEWFEEKKEEINNKL